MQSFCIYGEYLLALPLFFVGHNSCLINNYTNIAFLYKK